MGAAGTGLPSRRGDVATPLVDLSRGAGAGERASAAAWGAAAEGLDAVVRKLEPAAREEGRRQGEEAAAAGSTERRMPITVMDADFNAAIRAGNLADRQTRGEAELDRLRVEHAFDPDGFAASASALRSGLIEGAPADIAVALAQSIDRHTSGALSTIRMERWRRDTTAAEATLRERADTLETRLTALMGERGSAALIDNDVLRQILDLDGAISARTENPAFGFTAEQSLAEISVRRQRLRVAARAGDVMLAYRASGFQAASALAESFATDEAIAVEERDPSMRAAVARLNVAHSLDQQQENVTRQARSAAEQDMTRRIADGVADFELNGSYTGPADAEIQNVLGPSGVADMNQALGQAAQRRTLYGDLGQYPPAERARIMVERGRQMGLVNQAPTNISSPQGFEEGWRIIVGLEGGVGRNGEALTSSAGAIGISQIMPNTARAAAARLNIPFDLNRLRTDRAYNERLGREEFRFLLQRFDGDFMLAAAGYNAGPGAVDNWLRSIGDPRSGTISHAEFASRIPYAETRNYVMRGSTRAAQNRGGIDWSRYDAAENQRQTDPAGAVGQAVDVRAARVAWQAARTANRGLPTAGQRLVTAYLDAQERAGIEPRHRQPLPNQMLDELAGSARTLARDFDRTQDAGALNDWMAQVRANFGGGETGSRVLQAALTRAGVGEMSAQAATRLAANGPSPANTQLAAVAQRTDRMTAASTGALAPIPQAYIQRLRERANDQATHAAFDRRFGAGAAARVLAGGSARGSAAVGAAPARPQQVAQDEPEARGYRVMPGLF